MKYIVSVLRIAFKEDSCMVPSITATVIPRGVQDRQECEEAPRGLFVFCFSIGMLPLWTSLIGKDALPYKPKICVISYADITLI